MSHAAKSQPLLRTRLRCGRSLRTCGGASSEAVAEFAVGMLLTVVRKYHKAYNRVREGNFLLEGLMGFNIHGKTVGIIGTGKIGMLTGKILSKGFGATVIAYDPYPSKAAEEYGITYVDTLDELLSRSDIISLHCPLMDSTKYIINDTAISKMKKGVVLINTSRGELIDTYSLIRYVRMRIAGHQVLKVSQCFEKWTHRCRWTGRLRARSRLLLR